MRILVTLLFTTLLGIAIAFGVALLVGPLFPRAKIPVFLVISLWWIWTGFKYAVTRDRMSRS